MTLIIAEAGVNHNGSMTTAMRLIDHAKAAGANIVKFQTFRAADLATRHAQKAEYQKADGPKESQLDLLTRLELKPESHRVLMDYCEKVGIEFLSTPFDFASIDLLLELGLKRFKIPSGEITNLPYLRRVGSLGRSVILSTGMATLDEVGNALKTLTSAGTAKHNIVVLHCNTEYPTPYEDVNLRAMQTIRNEFDVQVGYSDHTRGIEVSLAAVALGATVIEKHFTLDRNMPGPDHRASLEPGELIALVDGIRKVEACLGSAVKTPSPSEMKNMAIARKSIVAATSIKVGDRFNENNLAVKRPGLGVSPMHWDTILGQTAKRSYSSDDAIDESELK